MKIVNKKRFIVMSTLTMLVLSMSVISITTKALSEGEYNKKDLYVSNGDTLWTIATEEQKNNKYYQDKSIRQIISDIKYINNLHDADLFEGQLLEIPIY